MAYINEGVFYIDSWILIREQFASFLPFLPTPFFLCVHPACPGAVIPPIREEQQLSGHRAAGQGLPTLYPAHSVLPTLLQLALTSLLRCRLLQALQDPSFYSTDHCLILTWVCEPVFPVNMGTPRIPSLSAALGSGQG